MRECDLIMKGGVTSGVAYPGAVAGLATSYRLKNIGGTSAGAMAAVLAAAAEYRRQRVLAGNPTASDETARAGFTELAALAAELGRDLASLFEPVPVLRPLYCTLLGVAQAAPDRRGLALIRGAATAFGGLLAIAALPGFFVIVGGYRGVNDGWQILLGVLLLLVLPIVALGVRVGWLVLTVLPRHDFGLCTGLTSSERRQDGRLAFTDWLHARIESIAGERDPDRDASAPMTVGDLSPHGIRVASMTTDLSSRRPWQLPLRAGVHLFSRRDFDALFPADVVEWMVAEGGAASVVAAPRADGSVPDDLHHLPDGQRLPLLVLARLSLSFPGLVSAVPLYREDPDLRGEPGAPPRVQRCLFSDGGISSNFPVHFFDGFLPSRPTFGIGFAPLDPARHGSDEGARVHLPDPRTGDALGGVYPVTGVQGFLGAIVNTAKDWQDTLQSRLPGYAERIVEIRLKAESEGGLHVEMSEETVAGLVDLGERAARRFAEDFDFQTHRWLRALVLLPTLEEQLARLAEVWQASGAEGEPDYEAVLRTVAHSVFPLDDSYREVPLARFAQALIALGDDANVQRGDVSRVALSQGPRPSRDAELRLVASPAASPPTD